MTYIDEINNNSERQKAKQIMEHLEYAKEQKLIMIKERKEHMLELRQRGVKVTVIAKIYNVTRQRVYKILEEENALDNNK
tara:strand:+ start:504 stop:743 length:240 start_codon:yes stop_codon:yes gene_type:complete